MVLDNLLDNLLNSLVPRLHMKDSHPVRQCQQFLLAGEGQPPTWFPSEEEKEVLTKVRFGAWPAT